MPFKSLRSETVSWVQNMCQSSNVWSGTCDMHWTTLDRHRYLHKFTYYFYVWSICNIFLMLHLYIQVGSMIAISMISIRQHLASASIVGYCWSRLAHWGMLFWELFYEQNLLTVSTMQYNHSHLNIVFIAGVCMLVQMV